MDDDERMRTLLLSYVGLLAEWNSMGPGEGFEFALWDELVQEPHRPKLVDSNQRRELIFLIVNTESYVSYNFETGMFQLMKLDDWRELVEKRDH